MHDQAMPSVARHDYSTLNNVMRYQPMPRNGRYDHSMPSKTDQRQSRPMPSTINQCQTRDINASPDKHARSMPRTAKQCQARPTNTKQCQARATIGSPLGWLAHQWNFPGGLVHRRHPLADFPWRKTSQERLVRNWAAPGVEGPPVDLLV